MTDGLDLANAHIHNSPDVRGWPATATITRLDFRASGVHVEHTRNLGPSAWPNFRPPGWDGDLQYTLWIFLHIAGEWHGSGCIQYWQACDQNGGPPEEFAKNWYYAEDRWGVMTGHQPARGELVGFMVTAGDARNSGVQSVQERSYVAVMPFPESGNTYYQQMPITPIDPPTPDPLPPPPPVPDPADPSHALSAKLGQLFDLYNGLLMVVTQQQQEIAELKGWAALPVKMPRGWKGYVKAYGISIPVIVDTPID